MYVYTYVYIYMCICIYVCVYTYVFIYIYIYMYLYIYIYVYMYMYMYIIYINVFFIIDIDYCPIIDFYRWTYIVYRYIPMTRFLLYHTLFVGNKSFCQAGYVVHAATRENCGIQGMQGRRRWQEIESCGKPNDKPTMTADGLYHGLYHHFILCWWLGDVYENGFSPLFNPNPNRGHSHI